MAGRPNCLFFSTGPQFAVFDEVTTKKLKKSVGYPNYSVSQFNVSSRPTSIIFLVRFVTNFTRI